MEGGGEDDGAEDVAAGGAQHQLRVPLRGTTHSAEPGRGAVTAAGPTLWPARDVAEAARPLRPANSVAEAARRRLPAHRPQGSLPRPDQEDCGGMFLDLERDRVFLHLLFLRFAMLFFVLTQFSWLHHPTAWEDKQCSQRSPLLNNS